MQLKKTLVYILAFAYIALGSVILFGNTFFYLDKTLQIIFGVACISYGIFRAYRNYALTN